jgi:hypothetical protein
MHRLVVAGCSPLQTSWLQIVILFHAIAMSNESLFLMKKQFCFFYFMMVRVLGYDSFDESRFSLRCGVRVPGRPINRFQGVVKDLGMEKASS